MLTIVSPEPFRDVIYGASIVAIFLFTRPAYLAFRRRRSSHGTVFNSITGKPEALAAVALRDLHGAVVRSTVTDRQGRYRLVAPKGDYIVEVRKFGFAFPSKLLKDKTHREYENILNTAHIIVGDHGAIGKNIPLDPVSAAARHEFYIPQNILPKRIQNWLMGLSPFIAYGGAYWVNSLLAWSVLFVYTALFINRFLSYKPARPPYGTITDAESKQPVEGVVVRVLDKKFNKVLETQTTSPKGRYAFEVSRGSFRILMKKKGYKSVILNFNGVLKNGFLLAKDVQMKRTPEAVEMQQEESMKPVEETKQTMRLDEV